MTDNSLINYISQCRQGGLSDKVITENLLAVGWPRQTVLESVGSSVLDKEAKESLIVLKDVYKDYNPYKGVNISAVKGVDLTIYRSEFVAITGHSGSGKTTLLNMIGLIDAPTRGEIFIDNCDIKELKEKERTLFRLKFISFIFQFFNLIDNYTALENIGFQLRLQGYSPKESKEKAASILNFLGLEQKSNSYPKELSGGEQQRIALGRALAKDSLIILADEPTAHLDSGNSHIVMELLQNIHREFKKTIILVTHEVDYAKYADRTIVLEDGLVYKEEKQY